MVTILQSRLCGLRNNLTRGVYMARLKKIISTIFFVLGFSIYFYEVDSSINSQKNKIQNERQDLDVAYQGHAKRDIEVTIKTKMHREIIADSAFSLNAKVLKLSPPTEQVINLVGATNKVNEKNKIRMIADRVAKKNNIHDEIEVASKY